MTDDDRRGGVVGDGDPAGEYRYFGPYDSGPAAPEAAAERTAPLGVGSWESEPTQRRPEFAPHAGYPGDSGSPAFPPPSGAPVLPERSPQPVPPNYPPPRRPLRAGSVLALAALTALVIGGSAGYAGTLLRERTLAGGQIPSAPPTAVSTPTPGSTRTPVPPPPNTLDTVAVAEAALPSTVMIRIGGADEGSVGSGFVLDRNGLIMTNNHVVAAAAGGARLRVVFSDGEQASASLVGRSPSYDIAVIRVRTDRQLVPLPVGDSDATRVGEPVIAIGSPLGLPGTVTQGIISAKNRPVAVGSEGQAANAYLNGTQTDAPINPGNSGGPLIDAGGRVIGVNSAILTLGSDQRQAGNIGLGFAIPINQAMQIGAMLIADGKATYPVIGADVADAGDYAGVRLTGVTPGGPADKAGLRKDDVVIAIDGRSVSATEELIVAIRSRRPGEVVTLTYRRGGDEREARVTLGSREG